jgi:hypothetical protein
MNTDDRTVESGAAFAYDRDIEAVKQEEKQEESLESIDQEPIAVMDQILAYEPDPVKREALESYASKISEDEKIMLLESLAAFHGGPPEIVDVMEAVKKLQEEAILSKMVYLRNAAFAEKTKDLTKLSQQVNRLLNGVSRDDAFDSMLSNNLTKYTKDLHEQIAVLSGAIYHMAGKLGYETPTDYYGMPIDVESLVKLTVVIGAGVKTWAATSISAEKTVASYQEAAKVQAARIAHLEEQEEQERLERLRKKEHEEKSRVRSSEGFYIMNHTGWFITCKVKPEEGNRWRLSPTNIDLTVDMDKALDLATIEDARTLLDNIKVWHKMHHQTNRLFRKTGVRLDSLFIGQFAINRVEG